MMVIQATTPDSGNQPGFIAETRYVVPAENCIWTQQTDTDGGYTIGNARYIHTNGQVEQLNNPVLGYIGKSGRFVAISN